MKDMKKISGTMTRLCLLHHSNPGIMLLFGIITHHASGIFVFNVTVPLRGSPVRANCTIPGSAEISTFLLNISAIGPDMVRCYPTVNKCFPASYPSTEPVFYTFSRGSNSAWIDILSLDRIRDQSVWSCLLGNYTTLGTINLTVFTSPKGVKYVQPILSDIDLGQESVTLICETDNCAYPAPQISWYYLNNEQEKVGYNVSDAGLVNNTSTCDQLEAIYTSTLHLTRGTTFQGNIDFKTKFACGVQHLALDVDIIYSEFSNYVTFAVYPSSVTLIPDNSSITFLEGEKMIIRCVTSPSRPRPLIRWWVDDEIKTDHIKESISNSGNLIITESEITLILNRSYINRLLYCDTQVPEQGTWISSLKSQINVWYPPSVPAVLAYSDGFPWLENRTGILECNISEPGNPAASVTWASRRGKPDGLSHLIFENLTASDNGLAVKCNLSNSFTVIKHLVVQSLVRNLEVEFAPEMYVKVIPSIVEVNSEVRIECSAHGEPSSYKFYDWIHKLGKNEVRRIKGIEANQSTLGIIFPSIAIADMGTYICLADNGITGPDGGIVQSMEAQINVIGVPVVIVSDTTFIGETKMSASIRIPFYSNPSITDLKFFKTWNNVPIANDTNTQIYHTEAHITTIFYTTDVVLQGMEAVLHFKSLKESDFGQYTLVLYNNKGTATVIVRLKELEPHIDANIGPSIAGIAGGIGGGVVFIVVTGLVIWLWRRHNHTKKATDGTACIPISENYEALQAKNNEGTLYQELSNIKSCPDTENSFRKNETETTEHPPAYINTKVTVRVPQDQGNF